MSLRIPSTLLSMGKPAHSINWQMIRREEGDVRTIYLPVVLKDELAGTKLTDIQKADGANYRALGQSGVTVSAGVDLAHQDLDRVLTRITDAALKESLRRKLGSFAGTGKSREGAVRALRDAETRSLRNLQRTQPELMSQLGIGAGNVVQSAGPEARRVRDEATGRLTPARVLTPGPVAGSDCTLTAEESNALFRAVGGLLADDLIASFNRVGQTHRMQYAILPWQAQTTMMSLNYQTGSKPGSTHASHKTHQAFWRAMSRGDLEEAIMRFESDIVRHAPTWCVARRRRELRLLKDAAAGWRRTRPSKPTPEGTNVRRPASR